ncbi:hypothetical protein Tco_0064731 [Tanacetum coccineum]
MYLVLSSTQFSTKHWAVHWRIPLVFRQILQNIWSNSNQMEFRLDSVDIGRCTSKCFERIAAHYLALREKSSLVVNPIGLSKATATLTSFIAVSFQIPSGYFNSGGGPDCQVYWNFASVFRR